MAHRTLRIALAQVNSTLGDLGGNVKKALEYARKAEGLGADFVCFPELAVTGYPPEDLLLKSKFVEKNLDALKDMAGSVNNIVTVVGFVDRVKDNIYNAAAVIHKRKIHGVYHKMLLPNYGVFDERRYFVPGEEPSVFGIWDCIFGVNICEDIWHKDGPTKRQALSGARLIININASPYHAGKIKDREDAVRRQARSNGLAIAYVNLVGGQDELVFDGQSMFVDRNGSVISRAEAFREELLIADVDVETKGILNRPKEAIFIKEPYRPKTKPVLQKRKTAPLEEVQEIYEALELGLKDYVLKNGFKKAVVGLSGGVDSSLVAVLASDALGRENVTGVFMPSRYSSSQSELDARTTASNLGINFMTIPIEQIYKMYLMTLETQFAGLEKDIAEENLQARIRGNILMALSNKFGWLVLTTGNKSEMSTGYATLYGDMAGGFAVIKDVPKTVVYKLARYRNSIGKAMPESVITKEPTAELKVNQKDSDTLPVYETLDPILKAYIEEDRDFEGIVSRGFERETVSKVLGMVDKSEYKRRQSPPGIKITPKAFGRDRRMPITNRYREF